MGSDSYSCSRIEGRRKLTFDEGNVAALDGADASAEELRAESGGGEGDLRRAEAIEGVRNHGLSMIL